MGPGGPIWFGKPGGIQFWIYCARLLPPFATLQKFALVGDTLRLQQYRRCGVGAGRGQATVNHGCIRSRRTVLRLHCGVDTTQRLGETTPEALEARRVCRVGETLLEPEGFLAASLFLKPASSLLALELRSRRTRGVFDRLPYSAERHLRSNLLYFGYIYLRALTLDCYECTVKHYTKLEKAASVRLVLRTARRSGIRRFAAPACQRFQRE